MKNNYLLCCLFAALSFLPLLLPAQCGITVNAGEDVTLCGPFAPFNMNGSVDGPYVKSVWSPSSFVSNPASLQSPVNVSQTTTFVLKVRTDELLDNLIVNPDFEQGNTGFSSDFDYSPGNLVPTNVYDILANPQSANDAFEACGDHTSGSGNMLAANKGLNQGELYLWCQTVPVTPNTDYYFSYWAAKIKPDPKPVVANSLINGQSVLPLIIPASYSACQWLNKYGVWNSGNATTATICFRGGKGAFREIALDDIFFGPFCEETDSVTIFVKNVKAVATTSNYVIPCEGFELTLSGAGSSVGPEYSYQWETTDGNIVSGENTLNPVVNASGTYTLTVMLNDAIGNCTKTASVQIENANQPQVSIASPPSLACGGNTTLIGSSSQPASSIYQWTASQGGNIVAGNNGPVVIVNQPGDYTLLVTNTTTGCTAEATVSVGAPVLPAVAIQPPGILSSGNDTLTLTATVTPANATLSWTTPNGNIASGGNTLNPLITASGTYILTATNPTTGCKTVDSVVVKEAAQCGITVNAGEDVTLCGPFTPYNLNGSVDGPYVESVWLPSAFVTDPEFLQSPVNVSQTTTFVLKARTDELLDNLIVNPDFEQGNAGFDSDLEYSPGNLTILNTYDVLANPQSANDAFEVCGDHTSGSGNMLVARMGNNHPPVNVWCQTVPVTPNTDYYFSYWAAKVTPALVVSIFPFINGKSVTHLTLPAIVQPCEWLNISEVWNSGNSTTANICFQGWKGTHAIALDDIFFAPFCEETDTVTVFVKNVKAVATPATLPCEGFEITLSGAGSSVGPEYSYQWETTDGNIVSGQNTLFPVVNTSGTYTLTVTLNDAIGNCTKTASVQIENANQPQVAITSPSNLACNSNATLIGSSSQPLSSTYQWTASQGGNIVAGNNGPVAIVNQSGDYTLLVTNTTTGCTAEATVSVGAPVLPTASATADTITCAHHQATLSGMGSSTGPNFLYAWSTLNGNIVSGQDSLHAVADTQGVYVLLVTNTTTNCSKTDTVIVTSSGALLPVNIHSADTITCLQSSITLATDSATAGTHRKYLWTAIAGGNIVSGADSLAPVVNAPGLYILLVTDTLNTCAGTDTVAVLVDTSAIIAIANAPDAITCAVTSVALNADGSSALPSLVYSWSTSDGNIVSGANSPTPIVNAPGIYQLLLTNPANDCTATDMAEVIANVVTPDVALSVSGVLNCNNASVNLINTSATAPDLLNHIWTNPDGSTVNTGSNSTLNTNQPGNYSLLVTNIQNGCTSTATQTVIQHDNVVAALTSQQNATCFGAANGAIGIVANGGDGNFSYLWNNGAATPNINNLVAGNYTVTVTDGENCTSTVTATVTQPAELLANASATPISVIGASDGTATASPQGGISPYSFIWSNGGTTATLTSLPAGFYTVTITDFNGCTVVQTVQVWDGECNLLADFQTINPLCHSEANGQATVLPIGGSAPFTYIWTSGSTQQTATGLAAGNYGVTVTDANDCPFSGVVSLTNPPLLSLTTESTVNIDCPASFEGSATVSATGGTGTINISWSNGQSGPTAINLAAGTYIATATDANSCTATATATIQAFDVESPVIQANTTNVPLGSTGSITLTLQMLNALATDNCKVATVQISPQEFDCFDLGEQQVTISAQDDSGNSSSQIITVTFVDLEAPVVECPASITRCSGDNVVLYAAPVAIDNCLILGGTFNLVTGLPSGASYPQGATAHTYTYTDMSGNVGACSFNVTILSPLVISLDTVIHDIDNQNVGGIQVSVGGSMPGYTYEWTKNGQPIANTEDLSGIGAGVYTLLVTDALGCKVEAVSFEVTSLVRTENPNLTDFIAVFPNPSSGLVFVVLPNELLDSEVHLSAFDGTGRKILEQQSNKQKQVELDLSPFADGLYSILIRVEQEQSVRKIFIVR